MRKRPACKPDYLVKGSAPFRDLENTPNGLQVIEIRANPMKIEAI